MLPEGLAENITFFDYALHRVPKNLRKTIRDAIESIEQPSLIVLGYGLCGNSLKDIQAGKQILQNAQDLETYRPAAQEVARYCERWGERYEEILGSDVMLKRLIEITAGLDQVDEDLLVVPPGGVLTQTQFLC